MTSSKFPQISKKCQENGTVKMWVYEGLSFCSSVWGNIDVIMFLKAYTCQLYYQHQNRIPSRTSQLYAFLQASSLMQTIEGWIIMVEWTIITSTERKRKKKEKAGGRKEESLLTWSLEEPNSIYSMMMYEPPVGRVPTYNALIIFFTYFISQVTRLEPNF